jgi:hypothetical protein
MAKGTYFGTPWTPYDIYEQLKPDNRPSASAIYYGKLRKEHLFKALKNYVDRCSLLCPNAINLIASEFDDVVTAFGDFGAGADCLSRRYKLTLFNTYELYVDIPHTYLVGLPHRIVTDFRGVFIYLANEYITKGEAHEHERRDLRSYATGQVIDVTDRAREDGIHNQTLVAQPLRLGQREPCDGRL